MKIPISAKTSFGLKFICAHRITWRHGTGFVRTGFLIAPNARAAADCGLEWSNDQRGAKDARRNKS